MGSCASCCPGHDQHLCQLVSKKVPTADLKGLVKDAKFICKGCGRVAANESNLCAPEAL
jgi:hypothetical protein